MEPRKNIYLVESIHVPQLDTTMRLSDFLPGVFKTITTKKGMKNAIKKGLVTINGKQGFTSDYLKGGEVIELYREFDTGNKPTIEIDIEVLFEDDYLAIVNKPAGIVVSGNRKWTLENALPRNLKKSTQNDSLDRPEPIHRLDYPTSGVVLIGKTVQSTILLNRLFEKRKVEKQYIAVTIGKMTLEGSIDSPIDQKPACSKYKVRSTVISPRFEWLNLVELSPHTGRKHQLRIHMLELGNPILGDREHAKDGQILKGKGLFLHALHLKFNHPFTKESISVSAPLPKKFGKIFPSINLTI